MNIEEAIKNCEISQKQIKQYDPDPFYVKYFFNEYLNSVKETINGIFEEANIDFGLFIIGNITQRKFLEKANLKTDHNAIKFYEWFLIEFNKQHENPYPNFIKKICQFEDIIQKLSEIKIMIRASDRYKDDIYQQIKIKLSKERRDSKEHIDIELRRQLPIFLELINDKRRRKNEPKVNENQVVVSTFLDIEEHKNIEIVYTVEIYLTVLKRLVEESREKIRELTTWN